MQSLKEEENLDYYVSTLWEVNAQAWIKLHDEGYNIGRDYFFTPKFLELLPSIEGLYGLDIGCGDGYNTDKLLTKMPQKVVGLDVSPSMIEHAAQYEDEDCKDLEFVIGNALKMPFADNMFDFAVSFFSMQDIPDYKTAIKEACRVIKPGGFLQFSITHPCFWTHNIKWTKDRCGVVCKNYFPKTKPMFGKWTFESLPDGCTENFVSYLFRKTFSEWINYAIETGFSLSRLEEMTIPRSLAKKYPSLRGYDKLPFYVIFRFHKLPIQ